MLHWGGRVGPERASGKARFFQVQVALDVVQDFVADQVAVAEGDQVLPFGTDQVAAETAGGFEKIGGLGGWRRGRGGGVAVAGSGGDGELAVP